MKKFSVLLLLSLAVAGQLVNAQTTRVKKTVLQAFWWDYWNNNFRYNWSNYLTELAPRLKAYGVDVVWIPPSSKCSSPGSVGYSPFDLYDLGDKYQKGGDSLRIVTRMGSKDDLLRMIAVMHANGIEVIEDAVMNHSSDAGTNSFGTGGQDPNSNSMITSNGYKNFRYVSYGTPLLDESSNDYWTRAGRWSKNYTNVHPNNANACVSSDICTSFWGPDHDYEVAGAFGPSSNIPTSGTATITGVTRSYHNPAQYSDYMRIEAANWLKWYKKQTNVDGFRFDAVKHFDINAQKSFINEVKYNLPAFASGGQDMFMIGEWVGSSTDLDNYMNNVSGSYGALGTPGEKHTGTYDFSLRGYSFSGGIYSMVLSSGAYNMQSMPGDQQSLRYHDYGTKRVHRSIPFVNNHDTYRPRLDPNGNFLKNLGDATGWYTGDELGGNGQHIDPREPRLASAYAVAFAVDGNPAIFFEDLFNIGTTGKRWSHMPGNTTDLPIREDIKNIILCHQRLGFKDGNYAVPTALNSPFYQAGSAGDHIVFERTGKALIGVTDNFNNSSTNSADQQVYCQVDNSWAVGTVLYDYSGAHGISTVTVPSDRRVLVQTAPVGHTIANANGHGYSIWAPAPPGVTVTSVNDLYNYLNSFAPGRSTTTTQEWEMADDLGDSHCKSLGQGGRLPDNKTNERVAGRIYADADKIINYAVSPEIDGRDLTISLYDNQGNLVSSNSGVATAASPLSGSYTPTSAGWINIKIRNTNATTLGQKAWVRAAYTAPTTVNTGDANGRVSSNVSIWTGNKNNSDFADCGNWEGGLIPNNTSHVIVPAHALPYPVLTFNTTVNKVTVKTGASLTINSGVQLTIVSQ
jgi:glycosidase